MTILIFYITIKLHNQELKKNYKAPLDSIHEERPIKPLTNTDKRIVTPTLKAFDGSYLVFAVHYTTVLKLYDSKGQFIPDIYFAEAPPGGMDDDTSELTSNTVFFSQPETGTYKLELIGSGNYSLYASLIDRNAGSLDTTFKGVLKKGKSVFYIINFDKENWRRSGIREGG